MKLYNGNNIYVYNAAYNLVHKLRVRSIMKEPGRTTILRALRAYSGTYIETNVRRYSADDVYAGRLGQAI